MSEQQGRMSWNVALVVSVPEEDWPDRQPDLSEAEVAERCGARILAEAGIERTPEIATSRWEAIGRGAAGYALAIEIVGLTLTAGSGVLGWILLAEKARELWRRLNHRRPRPLLSLGALVALCVLSFTSVSAISRAPQIVEARDLGDRPPGDLTYDDGDVYEVEFHRAEPPGRWVYRIDALGNLQSINSEDAG